MSVYVIKRVQQLPITLDKAWDFFSSPHNLREITPAGMDFRILSDPGIEKIYAGQVITYKVKPVAGIPVFWMTEITHVKDKEYFIDEQRSGPYSLWRHSHFFKEIPGGVEMTDLVYYKIPLGILGRFAHWLFVKKQLSSIFDYRYKALEEKFGKWEKLKQQVPAHPG
ncbi:MAG: SRPBCC family protein [Chitinophagaceae bacterium]|nr:SRPBCC family protein [Chitinophagaceae bacterium]